MRKLIHWLRHGGYEQLFQIGLKSLIIILGAILAALGYVLFMVPFNLAAGGISGLAIIINHYTGWPIGALYFGINIPLLIMGYYHLGRIQFLLSTLLSVLAFSIAVDIFSATLPGLMPHFPISDDLLLNAIYAGIAFGLGTGLTYRAGSSIGGTSIPANIIHKWTGLPLSQSYLYTDSAIIATAGLVFGWDIAMLAMLTLLLTGLFSDYTLEGASYVRTALIITDNPSPLSSALMEELGQGVSTWPITGAYTKHGHNMVYCTVRRSQIRELKLLVAKMDPAAFFVLGAAKQAYGGTGFPHLGKEKHPRSKSTSSLTHAGGETTFSSYHKR